MGLGTGHACMACQEQYVPLKNDIFVAQTEIVVGNVTLDQTIYKLWCADLLECPGCHHIIISGYGQEPVSTWHEKDHREVIERARSTGHLFYVHGQRGPMRKWEDAAHVLLST